MFNESLPPDLERMERDLGSAMRCDPSTGFPQRIAGAVHGELRRGWSAQRWKFAVTLAVGVLIWLNLSLVAASLTDFHWRNGRQAMPIDQVADKLQSVLPELSREEALRQAVLLQAQPSLIPLPNISAKNFSSTQPVTIENIF